MSNNSSEEDLPPFPTPEVASLVLENKPNARIHYTYFPPSKSTSTQPNPFSQTIAVYLNGLLTSRSSWDASISYFLQHRIKTRLPYPALLTYDRYGQGDSDLDPDDTEPPPGHGHDVQSAVHALKQFLLQVWKEHLDISNPTSFPNIIFVANSIGCAIARLFAKTYPGTVSALLFLDSIMANSDLVSVWPDPDAPHFDPNTLPPGVSVKDVKDTREKYKKVFHPDVPNKENLSRRNLAKLLPSSTGPWLEGAGGEGPYLTVVGHDWETFAEQSFNSELRTPKALTMIYQNPAWQKYNSDLCSITDEEKAIGPIVAVGCGHFVQNDGPGFVRDEFVSLLDRVVNRVEQLRESDASG
ncbi:hypothetical protein BDV96DRAFT_648825 [Lophiotrema nucula]|uniref:AB hydrolase-1 domain-containing protein n=1 Tax=Lophiotrema nucula TaxID=690887 RepID=A0A6A5YZF1_9PLEO|nr:hypothetical protein BDV96DRAFT_648825 [Lophiotrema nucula]